MTGFWKMVKNFFSGRKPIPAVTQLGKPTFRPVEFESYRDWDGVRRIREVSR